MAAFKLHDPPLIDELPFCSNFSILEIFQKSRIFCRDSVGARQKTKEFWNMSILHGQEIFLTKKVPVFNGKMVKMVQSSQKMAYQKGRKSAKNALKMH